MCPEWILFFKKKKIKKKAIFENLHLKETFSFRTISCHISIRLHNKTRLQIHQSKALSKDLLSLKNSSTFSGTILSFN